MDQNEDPRELELKIEQAERIAARIGDPTTYERLKAWADELRGRHDGAWMPDALSKRSEPGLTNCGNRTGAPRGVTWSFGFKQSLKSLTANSANELGFHAAALSSLSTPRITIFSTSAKGRCNAFASCRGARIQTSRSSSVVRITGIALGWIGSTMALGDVVRKP